MHEVSAFCLVKVEELSLIIKETGARNLSPGLHIHSLEVVAEISILCVEETHELKRLYLKYLSISREHRVLIDI